MSEEEPAALPETASGWDVYAIAATEDPHRRWRELRQAHPVLAAGEGVYFVTRWDLVDAVLRDPRHLAGSGVSASFGASAGLAFDAMAVWLMSLDGPEHVRARGLVRREFTARQVEALRPFVEQTADRLIGAIEATPAGETVDLVARLAFALPSEVIRSLFGIDRAEWSEQVEPIMLDPGDGPDAGIRMIEGLARIFQGLVRSDRVPPGLLSQLRVPDEELGELSELEVVANAVLLVTAAIDTTAGLIGSAVYCLLERPDELRRLRDDPALVPAAVEETLRFEPPALSCSRRAAEDLELDGIAIPAGSQLLLGLAAANRDPLRFAEPDVFDLDREPGSLLTFGGGRHFCVGATLARMEAEVVLQRLLIDSSVELDVTEAPLWQKRNPTVRALERLPLCVRPRQAG